MLFIGSDYMYKKEKIPNKYKLPEGDLSVLLELFDLHHFNIKDQVLAGQWMISV